MPPIDQHIPWSKEDDQGGLGKTGGTKAWRSLFGANVLSVWRQAAVGDILPDKLGCLFHFVKELSGETRAVRLELTVDVDIYSTRAVVVRLQRSRTRSKKSRIIC